MALFRFIHMTKSLDHIEHFGNLDLLAKQIVQGFISGLHKSPFHGFSVEFSEHRQYNKGEDTRHLDWRLYGRTDRLYVKQYEEETNLRCRILIDVSSSMYYPLRKKGEQYNKVEFSAYGAASIIELLRKQRDAFGISFFDNSLRLESEIKSTRSHQMFLFEHIENWLAKEFKKPSDSSETALYQALNSLAETTPKRSLIIVFSDLFDKNIKGEKFRDSLQHLKHNGHEVIVFHVLDKKTEENFELEDRYYKLLDMEADRSIKLHPADMRKSYFSASKAFIQEMKTICGDLNVDYIDTDIQSGFRDVLSTFLLKRKKNSR